MDAFEKITERLAVRVGGLVLLLLLTAACSEMDSCDEYLRNIEDPQVNGLLVQWADDEMFSRTFTPESFRAYPRFVGPGRGGGDFDLASAAITMPALLDGYTVRSMGPFRGRPDMILLAKHRYQGILLARGDFGSSRRKIVPELQVERIVGRVGMICYKAR